VSHIADIVYLKITVVPLLFIYFFIIGGVGLSP
jgi:hypothetical protein